MTGVDEKRSADRTPAEIPAHLLADGLSATCTILDISASGARLKIPPGTFLPKRLTLRAPEVGRDRTVEVVWRNRTQVGVQFVVERRATPR